MTRDISQFHPHAYPMTPIMNEKRAEANALPMFFEAWCAHTPQPRAASKCPSPPPHAAPQPLARRLCRSTGLWQPPDDPDEDTALWSYRHRAFYKTATLELIFREWAAACAPSQVGLSGFDKQMAAFAKKRAPPMPPHDLPTHGTEPVIRHGRPEQDPWPLQQRQHARLPATNPAVGCRGTRRQRRGHRHAAVQRRVIWPCTDGLGCGRDSVS